MSFKPRKNSDGIDQMDQGAVGWMYRYAIKNYWRVAHWVDFDDVIQEGLESYYEVRHRYPTAVTKSHVMSLFKLVYRSHIEILASQRTKQLDDPVEGDLETTHQQSDYEVSSIVTLIENSPPHIFKILQLLLSKEGRRRLRRPYRVRRNGCRETMNDRLRYLINPDKVQTRLDDLEIRLDRGKANMYDILTWAILSSELVSEKSDNLCIDTDLKASVNNYLSAF